MRLFERRIYWSFVGLVLSFLPLIVVAFFSLDQVINEQKELISLNSDQLIKAEQIRYVNSTLSSLMPVYVLSGDPRILKSFYEHFARFDNMVSDLSSSEPDAAPLLGQIQQLSLQLRKLAEPGILQRERGASIARVNQYFNETTSPLSERLHGLLNDLVAKESRELSEAKAHSEKTIRWIVFSMVALSLVAVFLLAFISRLIAKVMRQKTLADEAQEALFANEKRLSQARKEAVEVVAHDLKNPLATIKMSLQWIFDENPDLAPEVEQGLQMANRSADAMERLIKDLLDHAKIEAGQLVLEKTEGDLAYFLRELVHRFQPLAKGRNIKLNLDLRDEPLTASFDRDRLDQVFSNLIGNALKFTPSQGDIWISATHSGSEIQMSVKDSGPGLSSDLIPHIFDRFWQVKETAKSGHGLGLAIAKSIVEAHQGKIWAESSLGQGAQFFVTLPGQALTTTRPLKERRSEGPLLSILK